MMFDNFWGFFLGFMAATFFGFVMSQIQKARRRVGAHRRTQTVVLHTEKTPQDVRADHFKAIFEIASWVILLIMIFSMSIVIWF